MAKKCVIYLRISITSEESVSLDRQLEAARQYAAARGWEVVAVFTDDGVSASHNRPEDRAGWRALLESSERFDVVVIWKVDRLARRVLDFLHADQALQKRKAAIVAVEDPIDLSTAQGRAFAVMLSVFAELEASAISARVAAARSHLLRAGRVVGGTIPFGFRSIPNPDGPGMVLAQDPDRVDWVIGMVDRVNDGATLYAVQQWLQESGAPTPTGRGPWRYSTVERLLRHPVLAGMTPMNPGNGGRTRGAEVLRDADGLPVVDESIAVMSVSDWRGMVARLDDRQSAQSRPRSSMTTTSPLLSGLVWCAECDRRLWRASIAGRPGYRCNGCGQSISGLEPVVIEQFLEVKGEDVRWTRVEVVHEGGAEILPEIEIRLSDLRGQIDAASDSEERNRLRVMEGDLLDLRAQKRQESPTASIRFDEAGWFNEEFAAAGDDVAAQREVLDDAVSRIWVSRGVTGRQTPAKVLARLQFDWR